MTRRARLWITGATTSDHSRAQHRAPVLTCRPSRPALGRRPERQRPSRHGGDGIAFLDVLAAQLRARGWSAYITTPAGPVASLFVQDPHDHPKSGDIIAALDGATGALVVLVQLGRADRSRPRACRSGGYDHQGSPAARGRA